MDPGLKKQLANIDTFLDGELESAERRLARSIQKLQRRIVSLADRIETDAAGRIRGPKFTLKQAQKVQGQLARLFAEEYGAAVGVHVDRFDAVEKFIRDELGDLGIPASFSTVDKQVLDALKGKTWDEFEQLGVQTQNRIASALYDAVAGAAPMADLVANIEGALLGHSDVRGRPLIQYAGTYAHDSMMETYSVLHKQKADQAGLDLFLYTGDTIRDSRDFCIARAGKVYDRETIDGWNSLDWKGKKPGSVWVNVGGYRCRHHLHGVKKEWLDEEEQKDGDKAKGPEKAVTEMAPEKTPDWSLATPEENQIALNSYETAVAYDPKTGKEVFRKKGGADYVQFTPAELKPLKGHVFTHNHPSGGSFSRADVRLAMERELGEIRAVGKDWLYRLRPPDGKKWIKGDWAKAEGDFDTADFLTRQDLKKKIKDGDITIQDAEAIHWHKVFELFARTTGNRYTRTPRIK